MRRTLSVILLACLAAFAHAAVTGADVSQAYGESALKCLKNAGVSWLIVRAFRSTGAIDTNAVNTIKAAHSAGISNVDVYMFPCPKCGDPAGQVQKAYDNLKEHGAKYTRFWFDIEGTQYWHSNHTQNQQFFEKMVTRGRTLGLNMGVYTSASQWNPIMGSNYHGGKSFPLWYAHYDNNPSFSDFKEFGGWTKPYAKQYSDKGNKCGVSYDINYRP